MEADEQGIQTVEDVNDTENNEKTALDNLIDMLPFEMHVPGYKFCGPETKLSKRLKQGDVGINPMDEACHEHDIAYSDKNVNRRQADRKLAEQAFSRMLAGETPPDERTVAMMTACCMVSKITFEKFFNRIKKAIKLSDKKKKKKKKNVEKPKSKKAKKLN